MKAPQSAQEKFAVMTTQPIRPLVLRLAAPTIVSMLVTSLYNMADTFFVGKIGTSATAAVGVVFSLMAVIQALGFTFGHGSGNYISRKLGAKDNESAETMASTGFFSALITGFIVMALGLIFLDPLVRMLGATPTILPYARDYTRLILLGSPFMISSLVLNNQLRFQGSASYAMVGITSGAVLNVALDPLFIFGLDMGVAGAALATVASQCVAAGMTVMSLTHTTACYRFVPSYLRLDKEMMEKIVRIGLPAGLQSVMYSLSNSVVQASINSFGTDVVAAYTAYGKIDSIFWMTMNSFGLSITTFVGQNFGAGQYDRVKKGVRQCALMAFVATGMLMAVTLAFGSVLFRLFVQDAPVIEQGVEILHYVVPFWPTYVLIEILSGSVRGAGDSLIPMMMTSIGVCVTRILWVLTVVATVWHTLIGALACYPISWTLTSLFFLVYYLQGGWLRRRIRIREAAQTEQPA